MIPVRPASPPSARVSNLWAIVCGLGAALGFAAVAFYYVSAAGSPFPHQDDWSLLDALFQTQGHAALVSWVLEPYNYHYLMPARLAFLTSIHLAHFNLVGLRWLCPAIGLVGLLLWTAWLWRSPLGRVSAFLLLLGGGALFFNLAYWEYISLGLGFSAYLAILLAATGFALLSGGGSPDRTRRAVLLATVAFLAAAATFGSGYAAIAAVFAWAGARWLLGFETIRRLCRTTPAEVPALLIAAVLAASAPGTLPLQEGSLAKLYRFSLCVGAFLPRSLIPEDALTRTYACHLLGLTLVAGGTFVLVRLAQKPRLERDDLFGSGLLLTGFVACAAVVTSRTGLPDMEITSSRYAIHFMMGSLGLLLLLRDQRRWLPLAVALLVVATVLSDVLQMRTAPFRRNAQEIIRRRMMILPRLPDSEIVNRFFWPRPLEIRHVVAVMQERKLGAFYDLPPPPAPKPKPPKPKAPKKPIKPKPPAKKAKPPKKHKKPHQAPKVPAEPQP